ncbi:glycosyl hydrolase 115 family protein [Echinicola rosea]|uniref:Gylcosyl hydrolase 115 C-terminal domain-containing protein n=1 Tax=Echinicola rosea TaxID=1807691 RepID=A0ABQ1VAW6_9BACT|nr:glycosyl hydrolase 115 family protein [Echinicola rosea]GGF50160.1 hypothetical protein GCM10011339_43400 [Echinicola rosea]
MFLQKKTISFFSVLLLLTCQLVKAQKQEEAIVFSESGSGRFPLVATAAAPLLLDHNEQEGVLIAAKNFQMDLHKVTGKEPAILQSDEIGADKHVVIIGTIGESSLVDKLIAQGKLDVKGIAGKWETFVVTAISDPFPGVEEALVIAGSDKRGTIFGIYEMAGQIGVSPWNWWADVPVRRSPSLYVARVRYSLGTPAVRYRGIFINDEAPALAGWATEKFGGFNHQFYEKVYELILRLKGNFLWPAMWGRALYDDDPLNPVLADKYGVVIGTSHHEPLMRAHVEWSRYGEGDWNYATNEERLRTFWQEGMERMGDHESIVTLGMRGDGDEPMSEESNIALLEKIVADQREIIKDVTGKPITATPQVWALYKEVQEYYDKGMRVPDDVTLLLCDDNWGNVRKLPEIGKKQHAGGYGMYYHFDYVGGPRNYKWLNTNPLPRIWEQMHLTYQHGVDRIWIVNVGDIKPMELPTSFFLDYAWNPGKWPAERLPAYTEQWAKKQFGKEHAVEIARILEQSTKITGRRTPEMLDETTYSLVHYNEAERVVEEFKQLATKAERIYGVLDEKYKPAYYQLVLFPTLASANLHELYLAVAKNHLYAEQGRNSAQAMGEEVQRLFEKDAALTKFYNEALSDGKWSHMMDQTHIGYTYWQQPEQNAMPEIRTAEVNERGGLGVAISGSTDYFPAHQQLTLDRMTPFQSFPATVTLFNRGKSPISYRLARKPDWLKVSESSGEIATEQQLSVTVDWQKVPLGKEEGELVIVSGEKEVAVVVPVQKYEVPEGFEGFVESNGYIAMEAAHFTGKNEASPVRWKVIPDMGKTSSAVTAFPVSYQGQSDEPASYLEYKAYFTSSGEVDVNVYLSPTLNFRDSGKGLRFAISIDDGAPQMVNMHSGDHNAQWGKWVGEHINIQTLSMTVDQPGEHVIRLWFVDPGVVFQKIVVDTGGQKSSYLGPPESHFQ